MNRLMKQNVLRQYYHELRFWKLPHNLPFFICFADCLFFNIQMSLEDLMHKSIVASRIVTTLFPLMDRDYCTSVLK